MRRTPPRRWSRAVVVAALAMVAAGCGGAPPRAAGSADPPTSAPTTFATPTTVPTAEPPDPTDPPPTEAPAAGPPDALLAVDGGDPVVGSLGTYVWEGGGSDSPWLHGARIAVGSNESLELTFDPAVPIDGWSARYVPADAGGPAGAIGLGDGDGGPSFAIPPPGSWTVELSVMFADDLGEAHYFWQVDVS